MCVLNGKINHKCNILFVDNVVDMIYMMMIFFCKIKNFKNKIFVVVNMITTIIGNIQKKKSEVCNK